MNANERYYRRAYNAIDRLIEVYKNGYNKKNTLDFRKELYDKYFFNPTVSKTEFNSIRFSIIISLLGLNKESIDSTGKIIEYKKNKNEVDLNKQILSSEDKLRLKNFYDSKVISTDFDSWLSIKKNPNTDKSNVDYLRRVRNSLLHSNFYIDEDNQNFPIAKLKTKSYYEADLLNIQFQMFVFEYFSNIDGLGLSEVLYTFDVLRKQITNYEMLVYYLLATRINKITYKNLKTVGIESPELILKESLNSDCEIDVLKIKDKLKNNKNIDNLKCETTSLKLHYAVILAKYINDKYGKNFYKLDYNNQSGIISTILRYDLNSKTEISNWLIHFWYLYSQVDNKNFNMSFLDGDEFGTESCYPALMVLKSYLIMYRLQNNDFDEIDYSKINFDIDDLDIILYSENQDNNLKSENYFKKSFDREYSKGIINDKKMIWNKIVCEVIRNSLAHGNVRTYIDLKTSEPMIKLKDIDSKKGTARIIVFPIYKYEKFLNSEAFLPNNCYEKENNKVLIKK